MNAKEMYFKANYEGASKEKNHLKTIGYKIGGLVFTGQHQEARLLAKAFESQVSLDGKVVSQFHLGLSYTRTSDYQKARSLFGKNLLLARANSLSSEANFFAFQGASFFRFFFSKHKKSQQLAEWGYQYLLQMDEAPALLTGLSLDIQAHNKIQLGYFNQGIKTFREALKVTKDNHLVDLHSEIEISHLLYKSEFDTNVSSHVESLQRYLKESKNKNDYSKSEIVLQIAKLYFLMGRFQESNDFLSRNFETVYKNQNKRKIALLNALMAQLMIQKGQFLEALSLLNVAISHLDANVDKSLYLPLVGIKIKALKHLNQRTYDEQKESDQIVSEIDRSVNKNIQFRSSGTLDPKKVGEDKVADLLDGVARKDPFVIKEILKNKFLYAIYDLYDLVPGKNYILFLEASNTLLLVSGAGVLDVEKTLTKTQITLINFLKEKPHTKEELISKVWGYQYDPLRHDSLVYTSIARLRKSIEPFGQWIFADENHYSLDPRVEILCPESLSIPQSDVSREQGEVRSHNLNYRQMTFIAEGSDSPISVSEYGRIWGITRMTALRDLKDLTEKKISQRIGQGKATRYILIGN